MRLPESFYHSVRSRLAEALEQRGLDGFLATSPAEVAFLSGFFYIATERPVYLWLPRVGDPLLGIPRLDEEYAAQQGVTVPTVTYFEYPGVVTAEETLASALSRPGGPVRRIGVGAGLSVGTFRALAGAIDGATLETTDAVAELRLRKFPEEIPFHEAAARICDDMLAAGRALIEEALADSDVDKVIDVVADGQEAMEFLRREGRHTEAQRPDVILLDLNMPRMDGRQVLGEVKGDESLRTIPIVVLTTSNADTDVVSSYTLQANAYVTKPIDLDDFNDVVRRIDEFFGRVVVLPKHQ